jgi:CheY-like chemotaxis protein
LHRRRFAPKYSYSNLPDGIILALEVDEIDEPRNQDVPSRVFSEDNHVAGPGRRSIMSETTTVPVIAVVDDDQSVRESLAGLVESVGYEADLFSSAEEFLNSTRHRNDLRCLILDVRLPGMSGFDLHSQLTRSSRSVPTIFITAHKDPNVAAWALKPSVVEVLYKPFQPQVLLEAVRRALTISFH